MNKIQVNVLAVLLEANFIPEIYHTNFSTVMQKPHRYFQCFIMIVYKYVYRMNTSYVCLLSLSIGTRNHIIHWILGINFFILLCLSCWEGCSWWGWKDRFLQLCWCPLVGCGKSSKQNACANRTQDFLFKLGSFQKNLAFLSLQNVFL